MHGQKPMKHKGMPRILVILLLFVTCQILKSQDSHRGFAFPEKDTLVDRIYHESHALLIGVSNYTRGWPSLNGVKEDIHQVNETLLIHGFHTVIAENPDRAGLESALSSFINEYAQDEQNRILIYFAGHGHTLTTTYGEEVGYIVPADAPDPQSDLPGFKRVAIPISHFDLLARQIESKHALLMFDACFSGTIFSNPRAVPDAITYKTALPVRQFITSGSANENVPDESIFRQAFITAISTDDADANRDGYLTGSELGEYLQTNVTNYSYNTQHPQYGKIRNPNLDKGDFVFMLPDTLVTPPQYHSSVPGILRTKKFQDHSFRGLYIQLNAGLGENALLFKGSMLYSTKHLHNRYCIGFDISVLPVTYTQQVETFPDVFSEINEVYIYKTLGLYQRVYIFPQNESFVNFFAGVSASINNVQCEVGLRPFLTRRFMTELIGSYLFHHGTVTMRSFSYAGNMQESEDKIWFQGFFLNLNLQFHIPFK